jgi:hypothetical protein
LKSFKGVREEAAIVRTDLIWKKNTDGKIYQPKYSNQRRSSGL